MTSSSRLLSAVAAAPMAHAALAGPVKTDKGLVKGVQALSPGIEVFKGIPFGVALTPEKLALYQALYDRDFK